MDYSNIILEMLDRIKRLEQEVALLKKEKSEPMAAVESMMTPACERSPRVYAAMPNKRDTTRYLFEGNICLKNRLVLAVVHAYLRDHPDVTRDRLKTVFSKSLQGSIGVVEDVETAVMRPDYSIRFFTKQTEILHLKDGDMFVCSQWGILNISNIIKIAEQLGYSIEEIPQR